MIFNNMLATTRIRALLAPNASICAKYCSRSLSNGVEMDRSYSRLFEEVFHHINAFLTRIMKAQMQYAQDWIRWFEKIDPVPDRYKIAEEYCIGTGRNWRVGPSNSAVSR